MCFYRELIFNLDFQQAGHLERHNMKNLIRTIKYTPQRSLVFDYLLASEFDMFVSMKNVITSATQVINDFIIAFNLKSPTKLVEFVLAENGEYFHYTFITSSNVAIEIRIMLLLLQNDEQVFELSFFQNFEMTHQFRTPVTNAQMAFEIGVQIINFIYNNEDVTEMIENYIFSKQLIPTLKMQFEKCLFPDMKFVLNVHFSKTRKERKTKIHIYSHSRKIGELDVHSFGTKFRLVPLLTKQLSGKRYYTVDQNSIKQNDVAIAAYFTHSTLL